jgi:calcium/proton exchanger cax
LLIAILLPAVFDLTERITAPRANISLIDERLSLGVSIVLLLIYAASLVYTLVTHRRVFAGEAAGGEAEWSVAWALAIMAAGTAVIAIEAQLAASALEATSAQLGLSAVFMGVVALALSARRPTSSLPRHLPARTRGTSYTACASARRPRSRSWWRRSSCWRRGPSAIR